MNVADCYRILGVSRSATLAEVKSAFRKKAFSLHPDLNPDPNATNQFRKLNEAYVLLTRNLRDEPPPKREKTKPEKQKPAREKPTPKTGRKPGPKTKRKPFYYKEEEVLSDLLKDPFARQVFEDIYSEVKKNRPGRGFTDRSVQMRWGRRKMRLNLSGGLWTRTKSWLKRHLDDEQTVAFPPHLLFPGNTLRIQVSRRFSGPAKTIEVRLPADFLPGKPMRLKELGRSLGPVKGDLYLKIIGK